MSKEEQNNKLFEAISGNNLAAARLLLEAPDPDIRPDANFTMEGCQSLLTIAAKFGRSETVRLLLAHGADINWNDTANQTALHIASLVGDLETIKVLVQAGIDINHLNHWKNTALFKLVELQNKEAILLLLAFGADISNSPSSGRLGSRVDSLKNLVKFLLGDKMVPLVEISKDDEGNSIYRQADLNGKPVKTFAEQKKYLQDKLFNSKVSNLVARSLFKNTQGLVDVFTTEQLPKYLSKRDIKKITFVSKVTDADGNMTNVTSLKEAHDDSFKQADIIMSNRLQLR